MISPIKTIVKNLSKSPIQFRVSGRLALAMSPAGTAGDTAKLTGELFTLLDGDKTASYVLSMIQDGNIEVSYTMDKAFAVEAADKVNMAVPIGPVSIWYNNLCNTVKPVVKKAEVKPEEPKQEEVKPEEPKKEAPKASEPVKVEEPAKPVVKPEEPKQEEAKAEETKKEAPKAGRKIKVQ
jgi:hypothetical protein